MFLTDLGPGSLVESVQRLFIWPQSGENKSIKKTLKFNHRNFESW